MNFSLEFPESRKEGERGGKTEVDEGGGLRYCIWKWQLSFLPTVLVRAQLHGQPHRRGVWVIRPVCGAKGKKRLPVSECSALTLPHPGPHEFQTPSLGRALVNGCSLSHFLTKFYLLFLNPSTMVLGLLFVTAFVLSGKDLFPV